MVHPYMTAVPSQSAFAELWYTVRYEILNMPSLQFLILL